MNIIDHLYEAAVIPERWGTALAEMGELSGSGSATLFMFDDGVPLCGISTDMTRHELEPFLHSEIWRTSPCVRWTLDTSPDRFLSIDDHLTPHELASDKAWAPLAAMGFGRRLASVVQLPGGGQMVVHLARMKVLGKHRQRDISALDALRPHLARAGIVAARLRLERARSMVGTLEGIGLAGAVIDGRARVIAANALLESLAPVMIPTAFGGIAISDRQSNEQFRAALDRAGRGDDGPAVSIPVGATAQTPPLIVHLLPIRGEAHDILGGGHVLMTVTRVERRGAPQAGMLSALFDLTPAEARLVRELLAGGTLPQIALRIGLSVHTLRVQLRAVAAKTGVQRQTELMGLLGVV